MRSVPLVLLAGLGCCAPADPPLPPARSPVAATPDAAAPGADAGEGGWQGATRSPEASQTQGLARALVRLCARGDGALDRVAASLAARQAPSDAVLDPAELGFELRRAGSPHVWPRSWSYAGQTLNAEDTLARAKRWLGTFREGGQRTCGAFHAKTKDQESATLVAVDALADLDALPSSARAGQWLDITAHMLVPVQDAKVLVLGPRGTPRSIPTSLDSNVIRARFAPNGPGTWLVQVLADVERGPRPVLEALIHADQPPPSAFHGSAAPGESAGSGMADGASALFAMVNQARSSEGAGVLQRNAELDRAALVQAEAMRDSGTLGHDVGKGTVKDRLEALGLTPLAFGENVARAATPERAHRAIWASPSHRGNLLERRYDSVGIAAVDGPGGVWVTEVFAELR
ncbi:MAG: CAP domain-containing protein [Myxococcales bacterium]|nr:CAP domain-containing protein [Myxococcales bacterium]